MMIHYQLITDLVGNVGNYGNLLLFLLIIHDYPNDYPNDYPQQNPQQASCI